MTRAKRVRLRGYQKEAIRHIISDCLGWLNGDHTEERIFTLQAPTGSGKTIMSTKSIKAIYKALKGKVAFVWLTIGKGKLVHQAYKSLSDQLNMSGIKVYDIDDATQNCANGMGGSVVVIGWERLNKEDKDGNPINICMKEGDLPNFPEMCAITRDANIPIVLIIDESHTHANTKRSVHIRNEIIKPRYTLEVSATPKTYEAGHRIEYREVAESGMVKDTIQTKECAAHLGDSGIRAAAKELQSRIELAHAVGAAFEPKALVYIANGAEGEQQKNGIVKVLSDEFGWTEKSGDVVFDFSEEKSDETLEYRKNSSTTKFIITKTAIDTGVDIPSIQIVVQLRSANNVRVEVQKVGRGLRMPEQKHYGNDLDVLSFYVFAGNKLDFENAEFLKGAMDKHAIVIREQFIASTDSFNDGISIPTSFTKRDFDIDDNGEFGDAFYDALVRRLNEHGKLTAYVIQDTYSEILSKDKIDIDKHAKTDHIESNKHTASDEDIALIFNRSMRQELNHLWSRHKGLICRAASDYFKPKARELMLVHMLNNRDVIARLVKEAAKECTQIHKDEHAFKYKIPSHTEDAKYEVCGELTMDYKKFLYTKCVVDRAATKSNLELFFEPQIDSNSHVLWWARNYERRYGKSFSVVYEDDNTSERKNFFPDYVIHLKNGVVLILDTKGIEERAKKKALITVVNDNANVYGGIVQREGAKYLYIDYGKGPESLDDFIARVAQNK